MVENGDPVQPLVDHEHVAQTVDGNAGSPDKFAVSVAVFAEFTDELFFAGVGPKLDLTYPGAVPGAVPSNVADAFASPVHDKKDIVLADRRRHGIRESHAGLGAPAHAVAVVISTARDRFS